MNTATTAKPVFIRWMIQRDMADVLRIEQGSFRSPWTEEEFLRTLRQRNCIGVVAEPSDTPLGYMIYERLHRRLNILNVAVDTPCRGRGIGRAFVDRLIKNLAERHDEEGNVRRHAITAHVAESNTGAQLFFKACGFRAVSIERGYFWQTGNEDAYRMVWSPIGLGN